MDINTLQVGQNFALDTTLPKHSTENALAETAHQTKDLSLSVDTDKQESVDATTEQIETAVRQLSEFVQTNSRKLNFSVDEGSNKQVVKVTDAQSGDIIRQIPSEEVLRLSERLQDLQADVGASVGLLFNKQV